MATRTKPIPTNPARPARAHYGHVYLTTGVGATARYRGVVWSGENGQMLWESARHASALSESREDAYALMRAHAIELGEPVELWLHGECETVGGKATEPKIWHADARSEKPVADLPF